MPARPHLLEVKYGVGVIELDLKWCLEAVLSHKIGNMVTRPNFCQNNECIFSEQEERVPTPVQRMNGTKFGGKCST